MKNKLRIIIRSQVIRDGIAYTLVIQDMEQQVLNPSSSKRPYYCNLDQVLLAIPGEVSALQGELLRRTSQIENIITPNFSEAGLLAPMIEIFLGEEDGVIKFNAVFSGKTQTGPTALPQKDVYSAAQDSTFLRNIKTLYDQKDYLQAVGDPSGIATEAPNYDTPRIQVIVYEKTRGDYGRPTSPFGLVAFDVAKGTARFSSTISLTNFDSVESVLRGCASTAVFKLGEAEGLVYMSAEQFEEVAEAEAISIKMLWTLYEDRRQKLSWQAKYPACQKEGTVHKGASCSIDSTAYPRVSSLFYGANLEKIIKDYKDHCVVTPATIGMIIKLL